jgi:hypothetical protein
VAHAPHGAWAKLGGLNRAETDVARVASQVHNVGADDQDKNGPWKVQKAIRFSFICWSGQTQTTNCVLVERYSKRCLRSRYDPNYGHRCVESPMRQFSMALEPGHRSLRAVRVKHTRSTAQLFFETEHPVTFKLYTRALIALISHIRIGLTSTRENHCAATAITSISTSGCGRR